MELKRERAIILLLAAVNFTNILDFMIMMPLGPQLKRVFELNPTQWGLVVSSYTFAAFISGIISIFYIDKFDRKKVLMLTYTGFAIGTLFCGLANSHITLLIARSVAGLFGGVLGAIVLTIVGDIIPFERRGSAMGKIMAGFSAAAALGVPFGIYFGTNYSWHIPFVATAVMSLIILLLMHYNIPNLDKHLNLEKKTNTWDSLKKIITSKNKMLGLLFMTFLILGQFTVIPFLSPYMVANVGFKEQDLLYIYLLGGIFTVITSPLIGKLSDKKGNVFVFTIFLLCSLVPTLWITHLSVTSIPFVLIITSMFFIFAGGRMIPGMAIVTATAEPELRGIYMSVRSSIQQLASGLAASLAGAIMIENADKTYGNYSIVGYVAAACSLTTIFIARKIQMKY